MKIVIDIPDEKVKIYAAMCKMITSDDNIPDDFDESVEKAIGAGTLDLDLSLFEDRAEHIEVGITMAAISAVGLKLVESD